MKRNNDSNGGLMNSNQFMKSNTKTIQKKHNNQQPSTDFNINNNNNNYINEQIQKKSPTKRELNNQNIYQ